MQSPSQLDLISVAWKCLSSYEPVSTTEIQSQTMDCFGSHRAHKVFISNFPFKLLKTFVCPTFPAHHFCSNHFFPPAGPFNVSVLQLEGEGRGADQVLPRFLLRVRQDALRHTSEEVPQVQRRFRSQRLPPHLHRLMPRKHMQPEGEEQGGPPRLNMHPSLCQQHGSSGLLRSGGTELNVEFPKKPNFSLLIFLLYCKLTSTHQANTPVKNCSEKIKLLSVQ